MVLQVTDVEMLDPTGVIETVGPTKGAEVPLRQVLKNVVYQCPRQRHQCRAFRGRRSASKFVRYAQCFLALGRTYSVDDSWR